MEARVERKPLIAALRVMKRTTAARTSIAAYSHTRITANGDLTLAASDGDFTTICHVACTTKKKGVACAPVAGLAGLLAKGAPEITLKSGLGALGVVSDGNTLTVPTMDTGEYPALRTEMPAWGVDLPAKDLREMLAMVAIAASIEETRPNLCGVFLQLQPVPLPKRKGKGRAPATTQHTLRLTATDGHRMHSVSRTITCESAIVDVILPPRLVAELQTLLTTDTGVWPGICGGVRLSTELHDTSPGLRRADHDTPARTLQLHCNYADTMLSAWVPEAEFPDYMQVIPSAAAECMVTFSPAAMLKGLDAALSVVAKTRTRTTVLRITPGALRITADNTDTNSKADTGVPIGGTGSMTVGLNAVYLAQLCRVLPGTAGWSFSDDVSPMLCRCPIEPGFVAVVMPCRL